MKLPLESKKKKGKWKKGIKKANRKIHRNVNKTDSYSYYCLILEKYLNVQSCKLYKSKYMIAPTQITNMDIFSLLAVLVFKLLSRKVLFINRKDYRNC